MEGDEIQALRAFARSASPEAAREFSQRFFAHLAGALEVPAGDPVPFGVTNEVGRDAPAQEKVLLMVRGAAGSAAAPEAAWVVEFARLAGGGLSGKVQAVEGPDPRAPADARLEAATFQDLLDLVSRRTSPVLACARKRISYSGDVVTVLRQLHSVILESGKRVVRDLPAIETVPPSAGTASTATVAWMPNDALGTCPLCGLPWRPVVRQRHHCRTCGTLICGRCSTKRASADGVRQCFRCVGGTIVQWFHPPGSPSGAECAQRASSCNLPAASSCSLQLPAEDREAAPAATASTSAVPLPPDAERLGVLLAQITADLGGKTSTRIDCAPASTRETYFWRRFQAMDAAEAGSGGRPAGGAVSHCAAFGARLALCLALCTAATNIAGRAAVEAALGFAPRASLLLFCTSVAFVLTSPGRTLVGVTAVIVAVGTANSAPLAKLVSASLAGTPPPLMVAIGAHPYWTCFCAALVAVIICANRMMNLKRVIYIYSTASVPIAIYYLCRKAQKMLKLTDHTTKVLLYDNADYIMAPFLTARFLHLRGLYVKLGQWMANSSHGIPVVWQEHLKQLMDSAPADSDEHVRALLRAEFGQPLDDLFEHFEFKPVASASIAQVHRARLRGSGGKEVAVKLQHEDIEALIRSDLGALIRIVKFCCWLGGDQWQQTQKLLTSWANEMVKELDFTHEVLNLQAVRRGLDAAGVDVVVPCEVEGLVCKRAFAMEFCEGFRFTDMDHLNYHCVDRRALGMRAMHAMACQLLEIGVCSSDPHGGNLLCQVRGDSAIPVLLDFGNCIRLGDAQRLAYCQLVLALSEGSVTRMRESLDAIGFASTQSQTHPERDMEYMLLMFRNTGARAGQTSDANEFFNLRKQQREADYATLGVTTKKEKRRVAKQVQRYPTEVPDEFILFFRMMYLVRGLCTQIGVELPFLEVFGGHARRALVASCPPVSRARSLLPPQRACSQAVTTSSAAHGRLRRQIRDTIARCCAERPGLGVQVCVYAGHRRIVDDCGGVLGSVDPRPMACDTPIPLAELSRLPLLVALLAEARAKRLSYDAPVGQLLDCSPASGHRGKLLLRHVLAHRALGAGESASPTALAARATLVKSSAVDLRSGASMRSRVHAALMEAPAAKTCPSYMPLGLGYVAADVVQSLRGHCLHATLRELPRAKDLEAHELSFGSVPDAALGATLSSGLFSDMKAMLPVQGPAQRKGAGFLGPFAQANKSAVGSILESMGGLLVDAALANSAVASSTQHPTRNWNACVDVCPDLAGVASARALASVLDTAEPIREKLAVISCEPQHDTDDAGGASNSFSSLLALPPRAWDQRGFEIFAPEGGGGGGQAVAAAGLTSGNGLIGAALQWQPTPATPLVTAVVLTNELSLAAVPLQIMSEIGAELGLPRLAALPL